MNVFVFRKWFPVVVKELVKKLALPFGKKTLLVLSVFFFLRFLIECC
jgi:hypothetical protein